MKNSLAALLIASSVGIFYMLIAPTYEKIKVVQAEKAEYDKAVNNSQEVTDRQIILETKFNETQPSDRDRLEKFLPDSIDNIRLIIEIDKIAKQYNMVLNDAKISEKTADPNSLEEALARASSLDALYGTGILSFNVKGTYEAYLSFIKDLEKSLRLIDIVNVSLKGGVENNTPTEFYEFSTTIKTYWLKK